jgi:hypothetical protein
MKKKILSGIFALALLITSGYGVSKSVNGNADLSLLALDNVEALAQYEDGDGTRWQVGEKTITTEVYVPDSPGWSWDASIKIWLLNGEVTQNRPTQYTKTTTSVKIKCCRLIGNLTECHYEEC